MHANRIAVAILGLWALAGCTGSGSGSDQDPSPIGPGGNAQLVSIEFGRLVDVYGLRETDDGDVVELVKADVPVGLDVIGQQPVGGPYRFLRADADTLQPRLLIERRIGTPAFADALAEVDDDVRRVSPAKFGQDPSKLPMPLVPRDAGLRLKFSRPLGIDDDFFVQRDESGRVVGVKNNEAIQLLRIVGDPDDGNAQGDYLPIATRIVVRDDEIILDPVLLGSEGTQWGVRNRAAGLPESGDSRGANIRLAIALEGPLRIPGLREDDVSRFTAINGTGRRAIVRDFRSGNRNDSSPDVTRGFLRDEQQPRLLGEILTYVAAVEKLDARRLKVTLDKNGISHEIDIGDALRFVTDDGLPIRSEVIADPRDDRAKPHVQRVSVIVRNDPAVLALDPRRDPDYPGDPAERRDWLLAHAARAVVVAEFTASRAVGPGDDPSHFVRFLPEPLTVGGQKPPNNRFVSPFAAAVVRFSKPVDIASVRNLDTFFFATRNLFDSSLRDQFIIEQGIPPTEFNEDKYATPHLVWAEVFDEDGSQTKFRLEPPMGFYLDEVMRQRGDQAFPYSLHLVGGLDGIVDLAGNPLDFDDPKGELGDRFATDFTLDTRSNKAGRPFFGDNLVVSVARRLRSVDEDERPSYYRQEEASQPGSPMGTSVRDLFGAMSLVDGRMVGRPNARLRRHVDDLNQLPPPPQSSDFRWCPLRIQQQASQHNPTAGVAFSQPIQTPFSPFGARLQTVWREIDIGFSRLDPFDFDLDVEAMLWSPFQGRAVNYDEFDSVSLFLGHSEWRPEPCVGGVSSQAEILESGLKRSFAENYVHNLGKDGEPQRGAPGPHVAFENRRLIIDQSNLIREPAGLRSYLPLPAFEKPYFTWRDQLVTEQGGSAMRSGDTLPPILRDFEPYLPSPWLGGMGNDLTQNGGAVSRRMGTWNNLRNNRFDARSREDVQTGGLVGSIGLGLLADIQLPPDDPDLPIDNPFLASGINGTQVSLTVQSAPDPSRPWWAPPFFRAYSAGWRRASGEVTLLEPGSEEWSTASGAWDFVRGRRSHWGDNSMYWMAFDFIKARSVVTAGFVDLHDPHRMPLGGVDDPRLGPFEFDFEQWKPRFMVGATPTAQPEGASIRTEFRAADEVDPDAWRARNDGWILPDRDNFALQPRNACDAHIRKFDERSGEWRRYYNKVVTDYVDDPNVLFEDGLLVKFGEFPAGFRSTQLRYLNWRFVLENGPGASPELDSFGLTWRYERR